MIVVKAMRGVMPTRTLLEKYELCEQFWSLIEGVKLGILDKFDAALEANQSFFIKRELYLIILLQLKNIMYRNLVKKVYTYYS